VQWRAIEDLPPAARMVNSPYDPDARFSIKRDTKWTGDKVHLTETCAPDGPHLMTHVETTPATTPDWHLLSPIHTALAATPLLPAEHIVDAGYVDSDVVVQSQTDHAVAVVGPSSGRSRRISLGQRGRAPGSTWPALRWTGSSVAPPARRARAV
jgi:hypothetical protein